MKKLFSLLLAAFLLCAAAQTVYADIPPFIVDNCGILKDSELAELEARLVSVFEKYDFSIVIVTTDTTADKSITKFADDYYDHNGYTEDGLLLAVNMETREWATSTRGFGITAFTDYGLDSIEKKVIPLLSSGAYHSAFDTFAEEAKRFIGEAKAGRPFDTNHVTGSSPRDKWAPYAAVAAASFAVALASVLIMKFSMKTARPKNQAREYIRRGSFSLTAQRDRFLYSQTSRIKIEQSDSGGGSRTHTSSSGHSHGGHHGKF